MHFENSNHTTKKIFIKFKENVSYITFNDDDPPNFVKKAYQTTMKLKQDNNDFTKCKQEKLPHNFNMIYISDEAEDNTDEEIDEQASLKAKIFNAKYKYAELLTPNPPTHLCTNKIPSYKSLQQDFYHCYTCKPLLQLHSAICTRCAQNCHNDHKLVFVGNSNGKCDCNKDNLCQSTTITNNDRIPEFPNKLSHLNPVTFHKLVEEPLIPNEVISINYTDTLEGVLPYLQCHLGDSINDTYTALLDSGCSQSFIS